MKNTYPVTWWLMIAFASFLGGMLFSGPSHLMFWVILVASGVALVLLSNHYHHSLIRRIETDAPNKVRVWQNGMHVGDMTDAGVAKMRLVVLTRPEYLLAESLISLTYAFGTCCAAIKAWPKVLVALVLVIWAASPTALVNLVTWLQQATAGELILTGHMLLINFVPVAIIISTALCAVLRVGKIPESYASRATGEMLQKKFNTPDSTGFILEPTCEHAETAFWYSRADNIPETSKQAMSAENVRSGVSLRQP